MSDPLDLDALAEKLAKASPAEWFIEGASIMNATRGRTYAMFGSDAQDVANCEAIVAFRNHGEQMVEMLREARDIIGALVDLRHRQRQGSTLCDWYGTRWPCDAEEGRAWLAKLGELSRG